MDHNRPGQLHKNWRFRISSLLLPSVVAVDHPLLRKKRSPIPRAYTGLAGSQAEWNENETKTEWKEDGMD